MNHGNESVGAGTTTVVEETRRSPRDLIKKREVDRDVMQASSREIDRDIRQIEGALLVGEADVRHLVERLRDDDSDLIWALARLRDHDDVFRQTLLALARLLTKKPFVAEALMRLAAPRRIFHSLLDSVPAPTSSS